MKLTPLQRQLLENVIAVIDDRKLDGFCPRGKQFVTIYALEKLGLVKFGGYGMDEDGGEWGDEGERPYYVPTEAGRALIAEDNG